MTKVDRIKIHTTCCQRLTAEGHTASRTQRVHDVGHNGRQLLLFHNQSMDTVATVDL